MKTTLTILYFVVMLFIVAFFIADFGYTFQDALFLSATYLPTIVLGCMFSRDFKFERKFRVIVGVISFFLALYVMQLLLIMLANFVIFDLFYFCSTNNMPEVLLNPVLVFVILLLYYLPYRFLILKLFTRKADSVEPRIVEFISNRKKVKLLVAEILYIESRDAEVWLHVTNGGYLKSRTNISSWARELGGEFVRIHRSFLVNSNYVEQVVGNVITMQSGVTLDISRSYRQRVENLDELLLRR